VNAREPSRDGVAKYKIKFAFIGLIDTLFAMPKRRPPVFPAASAKLTALGARLALARKRRRMTQHTLSSRAGVSVPTLRKLEKGDAGVSLATVLRVLQVLGLAADIDRLAADDELGRRLQDIQQKGAPRGRRKAS
jgi:DNA-binding XRE family transcriptional regulator